jgi:tyrosyl-tRNA synthetase
MQQLFDDLQWRGLVFDSTEGLRDVMARERLTTYIGFDPTAASLHVGSLLPMVMLARLQRHGHPPIAVVGGGTGMIGDPSGKATERSLLTAEQVDVNVAGIGTQLSHVLDFEDATTPARLVNNAEWLTKLSAIEFMRDVGKYFTVNYMMAKESVKRRTESDDGISYTEFSYLLLQSYDFLVLHDRFNCTVQMGGSDQWGNITAGVDLIRRLRSSKAHGLVMPLLTTASGQKFGKTEAGAVWLDPNLTSPFRFYQFWLNTDDADAVRYLKYFTFLDRATIEQLEEVTRASPQSRDAQRELARQVTRMIHGEEHVVRAERASAVLFGEDISTLPAADVLSVFDDVPSSSVAAASLAGEGVAVIDLLASTGLTTSKGEATRLIRGGGVYVNNRRVTDERARLRSADAIEGRLFVLRKGAKQNHLVKVAGG